jgi:hypothetical protein
MRLVQWVRRRSLRRRMAAGDVNLEALGVKRLNVPRDILDKIPLYTYDEGGYSSENPSAKATPDHSRKLSDSTVGKKNSLSRSLSKSSVSAPADSAAKSASAMLASSAPDVQTASSPSTYRVPSTGAIRHERLQLTFSQLTCPICLEDYVSGESTVRELPCQHIFHPDCIDTFLLENSSICPVCKNSVLPPGYCPERVTDLMVSHERSSRRTRRQRRGQDVESQLPVATTIPRTRDRSGQQEAPVSRSNFRDLVVEIFLRSRSRDAQAGTSQVVDQRQSVSRQPRAVEDATGRRERMRRRAVEMLGTQPIAEVGRAEVEASRPKCKYANSEPPVRHTITTICSQGSSQC